MSNESNAVERYGRYEILRKIASGGMGEVYLAKMGGVHGFQKHVVIKKILPHLVEHPQTVKSLVREAKLLVLLNHPSIVQVLDLGVEGNDYFMAMEYVHGYNLSTLLHYCSKKKLMIPTAACALIGIEVLEALAYAHELISPDGARQNIIHRDVSPQNVMITHDGRVKLTDFGIAKVLSEAEDELTQSLKGKWRYMAPEAVDGQRIDQRYDLFAVGILLFESLCRRNLFGGKRDVDILSKVRQAKIPLISKYHPEINDKFNMVVLKSLQKDPANRYQTAREFAEDLRQAIMPTSESGAAAELKEFVLELFQYEDFPINKPKIVKPDAANPDETRSVVLRSRISADGKNIIDLGGPRRGKIGMVLLSTILLLIIGMVAFLAYRILYAPTPKNTQPAKPPVIIVKERRQDSAIVSRAPLDARVSSPDASKKTVRIPRPRPFTPNIGKKTFARYQSKIERCFKKNAKPGQREVAMQVTSTVTRSGKVSEVTLGPAELNSSPMGRCVNRVAMMIKYPRHNKPAVKFLLKLRLRHH